VTSKFHHIDASETTTNRASMRRCGCLTSDRQYNVRSTVGCPSCSRRSLYRADDESTSCRRVSPGRHIPPLQPTSFATSRIWSYKQHSL